MKFLLRLKIYPEDCPDKTQYKQLYDELGGTYKNPYSIEIELPPNDPRLRRALELLDSFGMKNRIEGTKMGFYKMTCHAHSAPSDLAAASVFDPCTANLI